MVLDFFRRLLAATAFAALFGISLYPNVPSHYNGLAAWPLWNGIYDYVVVGGGTGGITIGSRLAENGFKVAIVEAGGYYEDVRPVCEIPGAATLGAGASITTASNVDWKFVAYNVPGASYRDIHYPRGKCLGGSSALNFMMYQRPSKQAMERWAELVNDSSYLWDNVFPLFERTISFEPRKDRRFHRPFPSNEPTFGETGHPLQVSYPRYAMPFSTSASDGFTAIGINRTGGFNNGSLMGHQYIPMTIRPWDQTRSSSEAAFLRGHQRLPSLTVHENTMVKNIIFNHRKRAIGVKARRRWAFWDWDTTLRAMREVIISAGAFQSPQLLMVSGIGPAEVLSTYNIDDLVDLPGVGQNMWDHVFFGPSYPVNVNTFTQLTQSPIYFAEQLADYLVLKRGILTNPSTDYVAFEKLPTHSRSSLSVQDEHDLSWFPSDWPEVEYLAASAFVGNFSDPFAQQPKRGQYGSIIGCLVAPTSRGNVTIISRDTADLPVINPNWLATETDQRVAVAAYKRVREAFQSEAMRPVLVGPEYFPGLRYQNDDEILDIIKKTMMTIYHASGTCKMGIRSDRMAVVDHKARVFGVHGVRVVDASAFPILPPGHPQSTVYMLAEKIAADIISSKEDQAEG